MSLRPSYHSPNPSEPPRSAAFEQAGHAFLGQSQVVAGDVADRLGEGHRATLPQLPGLSDRGNQGTDALAALILGSVVAVLLFFIPVAAVQYRRDTASARPT